MRFHQPLMLVWGSKDPPDCNIEIQFYIAKKFCNRTWSGTPTEITFGSGMSEFGGDEIIGKVVVDGSRVAGDQFAFSELIQMSTVGKGEL